jgi:hypothetical protein
MTGRQPWRCRARTEQPAAGHLADEIAEIEVQGVEELLDHLAPRKDGYGRGGVFAAV